MADICHACVKIDKTAVSSSFQYGVGYDFNDVITAADDGGANATRYGTDHTAHRDLSFTGLPVLKIK